MRQTLVIGGTSLIGRPLVEQLLARGDAVTILHRGQGTPFGSRVTERRADRGDPRAVRAALAGLSFDLVFDNVYDFQHGTTPDQVLGTAHAVGTVERYLFMSSVAVYPPGGPVDEDAALVPDDFPNPYGVHKARSEEGLFAWQAAGGCPVTTLRPAFVYGPDNPFEREAWFWDRMLAGRPVIVPEDGERTMQWILARDVAAATVAASEREEAAGRAFNLAGPPITQREYVEALAHAAGVEPRLVPVPRAVLEAAGGQLFVPPLYFGTYLDVPPLTVDTSRAEALLGFEPVPFHEGLRETFAWYRQQERPAPDWAWEDDVLAGVR